MRRRFFVEEFRGDTAVLRGETAEHLGRVLRAKPGQLYELSDGESLWLGRVEEVAPGRNGASVEFSLVEPLEAAEPTLRVELLVSIVKFDRFEWCLEKAAEFGVREIIPVAAARTEKKLIAAAQKRSERWGKILFDAAQQSRQMRPPALHRVMKAEEAFGSSRAGCQFLLSERQDARSIRSVQMGCLSKFIAVAVGPEGGWTDAEFSAGRKAGFFETSLGEGVFKTETAVVAALAILRYALGE
jgi:16S rRNA (uracil1498-N3)-methyltransferase